MRKLRILVTGGAGFIGSHIVDNYVMNGHDVIIVDNLSTGKEENINNNAHFYKMDIRDEKIKDVFEKEKFDVVSHHASLISIQKSIGNPGLFNEINVNGTMNIIENCINFKVKKIIFASSCAVYGEKNRMPLKEEEKLDGLNPYSRSKIMIENVLKETKSKYGIDFIVFRYANVYGQRQSAENEAGVITIFAEKMSKGITPYIYGDGNQTRDFIYIEDVVKANEIALFEGSGIFNIGTCKSTSIKNLFEIFANLLNFQNQPIFMSARKGEIKNMTLDISKASRELSWEPKIGLTKGSKKLLNLKL